MSDLVELSFCCDPENTTNIEFCGNEGCCANEKGRCVMTGTGCFGFIDPIAVDGED